MKIFLINKHNGSLEKLDNNLFTYSLEKAGVYDYNQFVFNNDRVKYQTIYIDAAGKVYCFDIALVSKQNYSYFFIGNITDIDIGYKINYFFSNLVGIFLHTLSVISKIVSLNEAIFAIKNDISIKKFLLNPIDSSTSPVLVDSTILVPDNLVLSDKILNVYNVLKNKLITLSDNGVIGNVFFKDFILSLLPEKYWCNSLFFLHSKLSIKISSFFNTYNEIISLHIPVARSKYLKELFESLLLQTNTHFKIYMGVDGYDDKQKKDIINIIKKYKNRFEDFSYFVNRKNLGVGKTRWKLLNGDKQSKYIVFLDDDNFLSSNTIDFLYNSIYKYPNVGVYSIENIDVRFDAHFLDYIHNKGPFSQPGVYTNRERINRLPLYCDQEETPLIHNRFYSDVLNIKYNTLFDSCSVDMVFNRFLEIICGNVNLSGAYQFMRIGHKYHQTRTTGFDEKEFKYVMYILRMISLLNNNNYYFTYLIKTQVPKQNELFTK